MTDTPPGGQSGTVVRSGLFRKMMKNPMAVFALAVL